MATKLSAFPTNKTTTVKLVDAGHPEYGRVGKIIAGSDYYLNPYFDVQWHSFGQIQQFFGWQLEPLD